MGTPPMWSDVRWQARVVAVGIVRALMRQWEVHFGAAARAPGAPPLARGVATQVSDVLAVVYLAVAAADDEDDGVVSLQAGGLALLEDVLTAFAGVPDPDLPEEPLLRQYQAQFSGAIRPFMTARAHAGLRRRAFRVAAMLVLGGVAADRVAVSRLARLLADHADGHQQLARLWVAASTAALPDGATAALRQVVEPQLAALLATWLRVAVDHGHGWAPCVTAVASAPALPSVAALDDVWDACLAAVGPGALAVRGDVVEQRAGAAATALLAVLSSPHLPAVVESAPPAGELLRRLTASVRAVAAAGVGTVVPATVLQRLTAPPAQAPWLAAAMDAAAPQDAAAYVEAVLDLLSAPVAAACTTGGDGAVTCAPADAAASRQVAVAFVCLARLVALPATQVAHGGAVVRVLLAMSHSTVLGCSDVQVCAAAARLAQTAAEHAPADVVAVCVQDAVAALRGPTAAALRARDAVWGHVLLLALRQQKPHTLDCVVPAFTDALSAHMWGADAFVAAATALTRRMPAAKAVVADVLPVVVSSVRAFAPASAAAPACTAAVALLAAVLDDSGAPAVPVVLDGTAPLLGAPWPTALRQAAAALCMRTAQSAAEAFKAHVASLEDGPRTALQQNLREALTLGAGAGVAAGSAGASGGGGTHTAQQPKKLTLDVTKFKK